MNNFEYAAPATLDEVIGLLSDTAGETELYAGGTDLVTCLKERLVEPKRVVSLKNISDIVGISQEADAVSIGAGTKLLELVESEVMQEHFPALVTAAKNIAAPQMIGFGTVGGDLCQRHRCWYYRNGFGFFGTKDGESLVRAGDNRYHAIYMTDGPALYVHPSSLAPALIALEATVSVRGPGGSRELPVAELFQVPGEDRPREITLASNEVLTSIRVPLKGLKNGVYEVRHRHGLDWPYVAAAVALGEGSAKVVLGHVAPVPYVAQQAGEVLAGEVTAESAAKAGEAAADGAQPLSRNAYKVAMVKTAVKRAVLAAAGIEAA